MLFSDKYDNSSSCSDLVNFSFILLGYKTTLEQAALIYT